MTWNKEDRRELRVLLDTPFMQRAIRLLKDGCQVPGRQLLPQTGHDLLTVYAIAHSHSQGQSSVFEALDALATEAVERKPLPNEFEKTPPPKLKP